MRDTLFVYLLHLERTLSSIMLSVPFNFVVNHFLIRYHFALTVPERPAKLCMHQCLSMFYFCTFLLVFARFYQQRKSDNLQNKGLPEPLHLWLWLDKHFSLVISSSRVAQPSLLCQMLQTLRHRKGSRDCYLGNNTT